jgi:cation:H+ antiporter
MITNLLLIACGLILLIKGADILVTAASKAGRKIGLSPMVIGLTIVAIGTSLPEVFVSLFSAAKGQGGMAVGNIVGSNIFNIGAILGLTALIAPIKVQKKLVNQEIPILTGITLLVSLPLFVPMLSLGTPLGLLLLTCMAGILLLIKSQANHNKKHQGDEPAPTCSAEDPTEETCKLSTEGFKLTVGATLLYLGSEGLVMGAVNLATLLGLDPTVIGLTIVAAGTGSPEIAACILCALKKSPEMAIGNIVGSNLFNLVLGLGLTLTFFPMGASPLSLTDASAQLILTLCLLSVARTGLTIHRFEGALLFLAYIGYLTLLWPK